MQRVSAPLIRTLDGGLATPISAAPRPECCEDCRWNRINCPDAEIEDDTDGAIDVYCEHPRVECRRVGLPRDHMFPAWCPMGYGREERCGGRT